jgi:hypothetical protein
VNLSTHTMNRFTRSWMGIGGGEEGMR